MLLKSSKANETSAIAENAMEPRLKLYLLVTAVLVLAALALLFIPKGTPLQRCNGLIIQQNKYSCINQLAFSSNNETLCSYLPSGYSSSCYAGLAERSQNASLCGASILENATTGSSCYVHFANASSNVSLCYKAAAPYKLGCVTGLSVRLSNASYCSALSSQNKSVCSSSVYMSEAIAYGKSNLCSLVSNTTDKQAEFSILNNTHALASLNGTLSYMLTYLYAIPNETITPRDLCYLAVAGKTFNSSTCRYISSATAEELCTSVSARQNVTPQSMNASQVLSSCSSTSAYIGEKQCIVYLTLTASISTDNMTWCRSLGSDYYNTCYSYFASAFRNATYCGYISNVTASNACLANISYNASKSQ